MCYLTKPPNQNRLDLPVSLTVPKYTFLDTSYPFREFIGFCLRSYSPYEWAGIHPGLTGPFGEFSVRPHHIGGIRRNGGADHCMPKYCTSWRQVEFQTRKTRLRGARWSRP
jgi:hypothetical protein